jgi:hypothetical protein
MRAAVAASIALVLAACGGEKVDLGGVDGGGTAEGGGEGSGSSGGSGGGSGGSGSSPLDGTWTGYIESFMLPSGSDVVSMTFANQGSGPITGTVTFGTQPAPAPPTNPSVGYPTSINWGMPVHGFLGEGFVYTAQQIAIESPRVQLGVVSRELWKAWCALQPQAYGWANDGGGPPYGCLPNWGCGSSETGAGCFLTSPMNQMVTVDCGLMALCFMGGCGGGGEGAVCLCSATSCAVDMTMPDISFDMQLASDQLNGSLAGSLSSSVLNVHLTRQ